MINTLSRTNLELNRKTYQRLKAALRLNLRRQVFIGVCDHLVLRDRLAAQLQTDLSSAGTQFSLHSSPSTLQIPRLVSLYLDINHPDPIAGVIKWLKKHKNVAPMPAFQLMGVEQLSRQPANIQWIFLNYLQSIERSLPALESSLLIWIPRPWARMIPHSAPDFWRCRTAVFEFEGEPTPLTFTISPEPSYSLSLQGEWSNSQLSIKPKKIAQTEENTNFSLNTVNTGNGIIADPPEPFATYSVEPQRDREEIADVPDELIHDDLESDLIHEDLESTLDRDLGFESEAIADLADLVDDEIIYLDEPQCDVAIADISEDDTEDTVDVSECDEKTAEQSVSRSLNQNTEIEELSLPVPITEPITERKNSSIDHEESLLDTFSADSIDDYSLLDGCDQIEQRLANDNDLPDERLSPIPAYTPTTNGHSQRAGFYTLSHLVKTDSIDSEDMEQTQSDAPLGLTGFDVLDGLDAITDELLKDSSDSSAQRFHHNEAVAGSDDLLLDNDVEILPNMEALVRGLEDDACDEDNAHLLNASLVKPHSIDFSTNNSTKDGVNDGIGIDDVQIMVPTSDLLCQVEHQEDEPDDQQTQDQQTENLDESLGVTDAHYGILIPDLIAVTDDHTGEIAQEVAQSVTVPDDSDKQNTLLFESDDPAVRPWLEHIMVLEQQQAERSVIAEAYRQLGNVYRDRIEKRGPSPENLIQSMQAYKQALLRITETNSMWSEVLNDMGNLCWLLSRNFSGLEQGLPHLQQGITCYRMALAQINPKTHPQTYPMIQNNLGAAYGDLARYQEPVENLQQSIYAYQEALLYRSLDCEPLRYASTQNNLGTTYWNIAQHLDPVGNLKNAIASYSEALRLYRPDSDPLNYAMIQNNLGTTYWNLAQHEQSSDWLRLAIIAYETALKYRTLESNPAAFAATQNNLGTAYWHVATYVEEDPDQKRIALTQAIQSYNLALTAVTAVDQLSPSLPLNFDVLATHNNLGLVQYQISTESEIQSLDTPEPIDYLDAAIDHHLVALQGWQGRPELRQTALSCVLQTLQAIYNQKGLRSQNLALSKIPGYLLPEIMPKL